MPTVIRISGSRETIFSAVEKSRLPFRESIKSLRQSARSTSRELESTFNLVVSEAEGDNVPQQVLDTRNFMSTHAKCLKELMNSLEDVSKVIDFSWDLQALSPGQMNRFPRDLLHTLVMLGIDLEVSVYSVERTLNSSSIHEPT